MYILFDILLFTIYLFLAASFSFSFARLFSRAYDELLYDISCAKNGKYKRKYKKED